MSKKLNLSIKDSVYEKIEQVMRALNKINKSEFCEDLLQASLEKYFKKE